MHVVAVPADEVRSLDRAETVLDRRAQVVGGAVHLVVAFRQIEPHDRGKERGGLLFRGPAAVGGAAREVRESGAVQRNAERGHGFFRENGGGMVSHGLRGQAGYAITRGNNIQLPGTILYNYQIIKCTST